MLRSVKYNQIVRRIACWLKLHRWEIMARSDRHDRLKLSCDLDTWRTLHADIEVQIVW